MKIIQLKSENIKKIKAIDITPEGNIVKISGKNGQGKSSVLDSILWALGGAKNIQDKPIRDGEERAKIELDLGDIKIERSFTKSGSYLKVLTKEGAILPKGQEKLSELISGVSFDPYEFAELGTTAQTEMLAGVLGITDDLKEIDTQHALKYSDRTIANRDLKQAQARVPEAPTKEELMIEPVDVVQISQQLESEREKFSKFREAQNFAVFAKNAVTEAKARLVKLEEEAVRTSQIVADFGEYNESLGQELKEKLATAESVNAVVEKVSFYNRKTKEVAEMKETATVAGKEVDELAKKRAELIVNAESPIEGLNIVDGVVHFNGIPFEQLSGGEKIKVSMSIAMAMNPELRVIRILDASLLDADNMEIIEKMANEKDYQIWLEIVDGSGDIGFFIEEGEIK